ncbi:phosphodiester glycosidase family protein [Yoonia sp. 208BN28-4]|uniref:phosphodiester glycosidase family protein n=1 Tax=Yoonia sp. 208BN28-4 TaxID=3126505 RepID=UPI0030A8E5A6
MRWAVAVLMWLAAPAQAVTCADTVFDGASFTICTVDAATEDLRLFHSDQDGALLGDFAAIESVHPDKTLAFAMNAGMYHADRAPVGLYREGNTDVSRIVTSAGPGNFGLLPNGVLCLTDTTAKVYESLDFVTRAPACRDASQSGPMLVINGALHPRFIPDSSSEFIRNGVGTSADGRTAVFAIANDAVNFHTFGRLFRDHLNLPNALYFDGKVSRLYAPTLGRHDFGFQLGPMVGVLQ